MTSKFTRALLASLLFVLPFGAAHAQVNGSTDIIVGKVTAPDGRPLAGARVEVTSLETETTRSKTTNDKGEYTVLFPDGGGQYRVRVRMLGMQPAERIVARQADEDRLVANLSLSQVPQQLAAVVSRATAAPRAGERQEPGNTGRNFSSEQLLRLPVDPSDPNAVAALAPGAVTVAGTDTTPGGFSILGQSPENNQVTLDGLSFNAGSVPQEAVRSSRVITNTYDIARGQFSGGQVSTTTRGGTNQLQGGFTYTLRDPRLTWSASDEPSGFNQEYSQNQVSGGLGGPIVRDRAFYFGSLQLRRRSEGVQSLLAADDETLGRLGAAPDSVARFEQLVSGLGVPINASQVPSNRITDSYSGLVRGDLQLSDDHSLSLRGDWRYSKSGATRIGSLSFPTTGGDRFSAGGGVAATITSTFGTILNELRAYASASSGHSDPYNALPEGRVRVAAPAAQGGAVTTLEFGGNAGLPQEDSDRAIELTDEASWLKGRHRWKVGALLNLSEFRNSSNNNRLGTFTYHSLADFAANRPASFTRSLGTRDRSGGALNAGVYLGDTWRRNAAFQLTYGVRVEGSQYLKAPELNAEVEQLFGRRTSDFPRDLRVSPRVGFSWNVGAGDQRAAGAADAGAAGAGAGGGGRGGFGRGGAGGPGGRGAPGVGGALMVIRGGIGEFRARPQTSLFAAAVDATGLPGAISELNCIGAGVPVPDWDAYLTNPDAVPSSCVDGGTGAPLSSRAPTVALFDPRFAAPRSWRSSLGVQRRIGQRTSLNVEGSMAWSNTVVGVNDLNLEATPDFTLAAEDGRPVFVPAGSIVPGTGAISLAASRLHPQYGQVLEVRSNLRSRSEQLTVSLGGAAFTRLLYNLSYTLGRSRDQSSFGGGSPQSAYGRVLTAGYPGVAEWASSDFERRHNVVGTITTTIRPWLDLSTIVRATSGSPFTPRVGSDVNGDGARNDRAFIFDPSQVSDTLLANGMSRLLAGASPRARECLREQLGTIAARNSCRGDWSGTLDFQANIRPDLGKSLGRRLMISVSAVNTLSGIDRLLHGVDGMRGWGQPARPDPTLLYVRGFDPAARRFTYQVNERFGTSAQARSLYRNPFMLGLQARWTVGRDRQREAVQALLGGNRGAVGAAGAGARGAGAGAPDLRTMLERVAPDPVPAILALDDSLNLSVKQEVALKAIADSMHARNDSLVTAAQALAEKQGTSDFQSLFAALRPTLEAARAGYAHTMEQLKGVLTPEQWNKLPAALRNPPAQRARPGAGNGGGTGRRPAP